MKYWTYWSVITIYTYMPPIYTCGEMWAVTTITFAGLWAGLAIECKELCCRTARGELQGVGEGGHYYTPPPTHICRPYSSSYVSVFSLRMPATGMCNIEHFFLFRGEIFSLKNKQVWKINKNYPLVVQFPGKHCHLSTSREK